MIRPARAGDARGLARVHVDSWRAAYRGLVPQAHLDRLSYADSEERWRGMLAADDRVTLVASDGSDDGGVVLGFAHGGPVRSDGLGTDAELYAIYLLPSRWRSGFGRLLLGAFADQLCARGFRSMGLWVLRDNPACAFYQALGGARGGESEVFIGGACLPKVAFVWPRLPLG